jgi:poly(A) polymerase/tRNA nucleotidyltransferase (CCA-adding enzyme)
LGGALPRLLDVLDRDGEEARVVGGAVRNALIDMPIHEIDVATTAIPQEVVRRVTVAGFKAVPTGIEHGTVTVVIDGHPFEVTTLRRDIETDGRHARVAFTDDWQADAARRDFTINAMSMTRDGAVFDYFGGIADVHAGRIRFVGDPATRIAEDYLRILRFFRFFARYAAGPAEPVALAAIRAGVPGLAALSAERVWSESERILSAPDPRTAIALMSQLGVLAAVIPEGTDPARLERLIAADAPADPLLRLAALLTGDPATLAARLKLSAAERDRLTALRAGPVPHPAQDDTGLRRLLADAESAMLIDRSWLAGGGAPEWRTLRARMAALPRPVFPLEGRDVLALGEPEGPRVGAVLREVRRWWLDGGCTATVEACRTELARRLRVAAIPGPR